MTREDPTKTGKLDPQELEATSEFATGAFASRAAPETAQRLAIDAVLGRRFRIVRALGSGGMGEVYEAEDLELGQRVALKTLRSSVASDEQALQRFQREIITARRVTHEGVCRTFDFFRHRQDDKGDRTAFLTMELLEGETLSDRIRRLGPFKPDEALPLIRQMTEALAAAHRAGIIHRDFKSSNVILVPQASGLRAVITDFGLAQDTLTGGDDMDMTRTGQLLGSPAYIAPEQVEGLEITPRTDLYSLGVVIYEMLTGHRPFEGKSLVTVLARRLNEDPLPPSQHRPELDLRWDALVLRCMARDPARRFQRAEDLLRALESPGLPELPDPLPEVPPEPATESSASHPLPTGLGDPSPSSRKGWLPFAALLSLVLVAALVMNWRQQRNAEPPSESGEIQRPSIAVLPLNNRSRQPEADWLGPTVAEMLTSELGIGGKLRLISGEMVGRMERDLAPPRTDSLAPDTLEQIREYLNTDLVVLGSYFQDTSSEAPLLRLDLRIQKTIDGETVATLRETFAEDQLLHLVPEIGLEIRRQLGFEPPPASSTKHNLPATPQAARFYTAGLENLRRFELPQAAELLREAVAEDPRHAPSYLALGETLWTQGTQKEAREQFAKAVEHSSNLPRQEQLFAQARYHESMTEWQPAIEGYEALFGVFPDEVEYGIALARVLKDSGQNRRALDLLESMRKTSADGYLDPRIDLERGQTLMQLSDYRTAREVAVATRERAEAMGARFLLPYALRLEAGALWRLGQIEIAQETTAKALRLCQANGDTLGLAHAGNLAGILAYTRGHLDEAQPLFQESLDAFRHLGNLEGQRDMLNNLGIIANQKGDLVRSAELFEETLDLAHETADQHATATALTNLAMVTLLQGDPGKALEKVTEALDLTQQTGERIRSADALRVKAEAHRFLGNLPAARQAIESAQQLIEEDDSPHIQAVILNIGANLSFLAGELEPAREQLEFARDLHRELSGEERVAITLIRLEVLEHEMGQSEEALEQLYQLAETFRSNQRSQDEATTRLYLAELELHSGHPIPAREALARTRELLQESQNYLEVAHLRTLELWAAEEPDPSKLDELRNELRKRDLRHLLLEVEMVRGAIERRQSPAAGREILLRVEQQARAEGLEIVARRAQRLYEDRPSS